MAKGGKPLARPRLSVALVGPDGAGKSTITARLRQAALPAPVKTIYMGVNLEASTMMLPTTRLLLAAKRARGGRPDLVASSLRDVDDAPSAPVGRGAAVKSTARMAVWMTEEWLRQLVALGHGLRGRIVIFDRHFFLDYYHADVDHEHGQGRSRGAAQRLHGWMLERLYPKPDLVILLDAPAEVLHARKPEATVAWLERRRQQYQELASLVPEFVVVDVDRPLDAAVSEVVAAIESSWKAKCA
jgi:thymidylate kinase